MKLGILALTLFAVNSFAQTAGKPFQLPGGKYSVECWSAGNTAGQGQMFRSSGYDKGDVTVVTQGDTSVEYTQLSGDGVVSNSVDKTTTLPTPDGSFKVITESNSTISYDGKTESSSMKAEAIYKVDGNRAWTVSVKVNGRAERPGVGETAWKIMDDGRIVHQSFVREKSSYIDEKGVQREIFGHSNICIYTKAQK